MANVRIDKFALLATFKNQKQAFQEPMDRYVVPQLQGEKQNLLQEIANHDVSKDIDNKDGNLLYGLIGFQQG